MCIVIEFDHISFAIKLLFENMMYCNKTTIIFAQFVIENKGTDNMYRRSELDWLISNAPLEYTDLILNGDPEKYLKTVTVNKPFEN